MTARRRAALCLLESPLPRAAERLAVFAKQRASRPSCKRRPMRWTTPTPSRAASRGQARHRPARPSAGWHGCACRWRCCNWAASPAMRWRMTGPAGSNPVRGPGWKSACKVCGPRRCIERWHTADTAAAAEVYDRLVPPWELDRRAADKRDASGTLYRSRRGAIALARGALSGRRAGHRGQRPRRPGGRILPRRRRRDAPRRL